MERRYTVDPGSERFPGVVLGGSPLRLFRVTNSGEAVLDRIDAGEAVPESTLVTALLDAGAIHPLPSVSRFGANDVTTVVPTLGPPARRPEPPVIVIDDGSEPPVPDATLRLDRGRGPGPARNAGLALVDTPLVAFVDADVELPPGWLAPLVAHFDDDRVALVAPRVRSRPGSSRLAAYEAANGPLDLGTVPARVRAGTKVSYVPSAAIVCRTDAVRAAGGFDERLRFGEDVDLVWRLDELGWRCRYEPAVAVEHAPRPSWRSWIRQRFDYGTSAAPLAARHPAALAPLRMNGWSLATWTLAVAGHGFVALATGVGSAVALVPKLRVVPVARTVRIGLHGNLRAGEQLASAIRRAYWPIVGVAALRSVAARRALVASIVAARSPIRVVDDVAYSVGVWRGAVATRSAAALRPRLTAWPPRARRRAGRTRYRRIP